MCVPLAPTPLSAVLVRLLSPVGHTKLSGNLSHDTQAKCVGAARDNLVRYTAFAMHARPYLAQRWDRSTQATIDRATHHGLGMRLFRELRAI